MKLTKGKSVGKAIDSLVQSGTVRPSVAGHLKLATIFAQDRIRELGSDGLVGGGSKAIDERYFEGTPDELKAARTSQRTGAKKEYADSTPAEYRSIIKDAFNSKAGKEMLHTSLKRRVVKGKIPKTARIDEKVKEAAKDTKFGGTVRLAPAKPEGPETRPGVAGLKMLAAGSGGSMISRGRVGKPTYGPGSGMHTADEMTLFHGMKVPGEDLPAESKVNYDSSKIEKLRKAALRPIPKVDRIHGRAEGNKLDQLKALANDKSKSEQVRLIARTLYIGLANRQNKELAGFTNPQTRKNESRSMSTGPRPKPKLVQTKPEFIPELGKVASRKVAVAANPSAYAQAGAARSKDLEQDDSGQFIQRGAKLENEYDPKDKRYGLGGMFGTRIVRRPKPAGKVKIATPSSGEQIGDKKILKGQRVGRFATSTSRKGDEPPLSSPRGRMALRVLKEKFKDSSNRQGEEGAKETNTRPLRRFPTTGREVVKPKPAAKTGSAPKPVVRRKVVRRVAKKVETKAPLPKGKRVESIYARGASRPRAGVTG
jgi:hypothetical protein